MPAITSTERDGVVVISLHRPPVNALDVETLDELNDALKEAAPGDPDACVLAAEGIVFSAGADLNRVLEAARRGTATDDQIKEAWRSPEVLAAIRAQMERLTRGSRR